MTSTSPPRRAPWATVAVGGRGAVAVAVVVALTPSTTAPPSPGPLAATDRLSEHGAEHGLCRVYANEPWHHELRPDAVEHGCPPPYPDPTHDPRTQR